MKAATSTITFASLIIATEALSAPTWFNEQSQQRVGNTFSVNCSGTGISLDIARSNAIASCKATATNQLIDSATVKTLAIETETETAYHQEIKQSKFVTGLICQPQKESIEEKDEIYSVYIKCRFDLSKMSVTAIPEISETGTNNNQSVIKNKIEVENLKSDSHFSKPAYQKSAQTRLIISTVPMCSTILIRGGKFRSITCNANPETVILEPGDTELILRANGFKPKTINLESSGRSDDDSITVIFQ